MTQERMHTFTGMLGYITKDVGKPHFRLRTKGVQSEEILEGMQLYSMDGECALKKRVELTPGNFLDRVVQFVATRNGGLANIWDDFTRFSLNATLTAMIRTGKFYP